MGNQLKVTRLFNVSNFGIYNSDCARDLPRGGLMEPVFSMNETNVRNADKVYLVDHGRNLVYEMPYGQIVYDPKHVYSLCVINKGEIFLCDKQTFMALLKTDDSKVPLTALPPEANDVSDFRTALGI